jgi:hypothetical protein
MPAILAEFVPVPNVPSDVETERHPTAADSSSQPAARAVRVPAGAAPVPEENGGPSGPEPTRLGDWERIGRCIDF